MDLLLPSWLTAAGSILSTLGIGALLLRLVDHWFGRVNKQDDLAIGLRVEMIRRLDELTAEVGVLRQERDHEYRHRVHLESEVRVLRSRFGAVVRWLRANPSIPVVPDWVFEDVPPPTQEG